MMSKEAIKLALEALEGLEALLLSMGLTHLIVYGDAEKAITNLQKALANEALDKMAENARELGLDYEPVQQCNHCNGSGRMVRDPDIGTDQECFVCDGSGTIKPEQPAQDMPKIGCVNHDCDVCKAQQEPVAIDRSDAVNLARTMLEVRNCKGITSYGVRVLCEAVMKMDAALYTSPQAREPLTDDEIHDIYDEVARREPYNMAVTRRNIARAIEAKLREKNT